MSYTHSRSRPHVLREARRAKWSRGRANQLILISLWPHRLVVRTPGFHPGNRSSILLGATKITIIINVVISLCCFSEVVIIVRFMIFSQVLGYITVEQSSSCQI